MNPSLILIAIAALLWGTAGISGKYISNICSISPLAIGAWRLALASPFLLLVCYIKNKTNISVQKKHFKFFLIYGLAVAANQLTYFTAVRISMVSTATLIAICISPLFAAILSRIFIKERIKPLIYVVLILSIMGTTLVMDINNIDLSLQSGYLWSYLLAVGAGLSYAIYNVTSKHLLNSYDPLIVIALTFTLGALLLLPCIEFPHAAPLKVWLALLYLGMVPTALAYILFILGLKKTTVTAAAIISLLEPLFSTFLSLTLMGERLSKSQGMGAFLLISSLVLISIEKNDDEIEKKVN